MPNLEKSVQYGNTEGQPFDDLNTAINFNKPITGLNMRTGNIIDSIQAVYGSNAAPAHGGTGGSATTVRLDAGDYFTEISGFTGNWFGPVFVLQLAFHSRYGKIVYQPANPVFGNMDYSSNRVAFSIQAPQGMQIRALYGTTFATNNGQLTVLASLGAYFHIAPAEAGDDKKLANGLAIYADNIFGGEGVPGCALIVCRQTIRNGVASYELNYYGYAGAGRVVPNPNTNFCIGSVTKSFTGSVLAARILEGGSYSIAAKVAGFLPLPADVSRDARILKTTLGQLATHTSCFVHNFGGQDHGAYNGNPSTLGELNPSNAQVKEWTNSEKNFQNGDKNPCVVQQSQRYSNWGFKTLAFAVCKPEPPAEYYNYDPVLAQYVNYLFLLQHTNTQESTKVPLGYLYNDDQKKLVEAGGKANGIRSSVGDMATFLASYLVGLYQAANDPNPSQLAKTVKQAVTQPYLPKATNALGWGVSQFAGHQLISKNGSTSRQGYSAWIGLLPDLNVKAGNGVYHQAGVVVLVNCASPKTVASSPKKWQGQTVGPKPEALGQLVLQYLISPTGTLDGFEPAAPPEEDDDED